MSRALRTDVAPSTDTIVRFKDEKPFDVRQVESRRVREKYPDLIPVICERADNSDLPDTTRRKYLVPQALTMGQFMYVLRRRINLDANRAMFLFIDNNTLAPSAELVSSVFEEHKDEDGFLYMTYNGESTFGGAQ
jgi:GABA(A) receptor-associated protein